MPVFGYNVHPTLVYAPQENLLSPIIIRFNFHTFDTCIRHVVLPGDDEPIILQEWTSPYTHGTSIDLPASPASQQSAEALQRETMTSIGIPPQVHDSVVHRVDSEIGPLLQEAWDNCFDDVVALILLDIYVTEFFSESCDLNHPCTRGLLLGIGIRLPIPASKSSIDGLTRVKFVDDGILGRDESCSVCMEEFENGDDMIQLPCSHLYHQDCIVKWLMSSHFCPLCRYEMPADEPCSNCQSTSTNQSSNLIIRYLHVIS